MKRERDNQRSKVYAAENAAFRQSNLDIDLSDMANVKKYAEKVLASAFIQARYSSATKSPIHYGDGRARCSAAADYRGVYLPRGTRTRMYVLHELAHVITIRMYGSQTAGHGWRFCAVYLDMVQAGWGDDMREHLKRHFKAKRVKFTEPRKARIISPEEKAALIERMAKARAARKQAA